jgi:hypothetical protein
MFDEPGNAAEVLLRILQGLLLLAITIMVVSHWRFDWMLYVFAGIGIALLFVLGVTVGIKLAPSVRHPRE